MNDHDSAIDGHDCPGPSNTSCSLFLISVLGLYLEMLLIRWISTEIRIFAYLQNTVLVVCFLGLGLGCFTCRQRIRLLDILMPLVCLCVLLVFPPFRYGLYCISPMLSVLSDLDIWHHGISSNPSTTLAYLLIGFFLTFMVLVLIVDIFVPVGRLLGRLFNEHPKTLQAYSVNVAGSLIGTWLMVALSGFHTTPFTWFLVLGVLMIPFLRHDPRWRYNIVLLSGVIGMAWCVSREPGALETVWSSYQKLALRRVDATEDSVGEFVVNVNNTGYQGMLDLSPGHLDHNPSRFPAEGRGLSQYDVPLLLHPRPSSVLVVGAGSGNDVAGALRHGATKVTAVEIDPVIISMGRRYHPEKPYDSPAVEIVVDDARSFFARCQSQYDVIIFGLLDAHTTTAMTNARLDHYVYTQESIARARALLSPGGVMVLTFDAGKTYIADRMAGVLSQVFDSVPIFFRIPYSSYGWGGVMFVTGDLASVRQRISEQPDLAGLIAKWQVAQPLNLTYSSRIATDDWPYIYLAKATIPTLYYLFALLLALLLVRSVKKTRAHGLLTRWRASHWHFFFLGAGFLLLEVQNISKAAVVLGNTWQVNAVIVSGVLVMILLANLTSSRFPHIPQRFMFGALCLICVALYFVDLSRFAFLPYFAKATLVAGLTTLPMFFSGIIFIRSFTVARMKDEALGANLIGALSGAMLQSVSFVTGIKALLLLVAGFYLLAWIMCAGEATQN